MRSETSFELDGDLIVVVQLSTLDFTVPHVADLGHGIDGILGMNFLSD